MALFFKILLTVVFSLQLLSIFTKDIKEEEETAAAIVVLFLGFLITGIWTVL